MQGTHVTHHSALALSPVANLLHPRPATSRHPEQPPDTDPRHKDTNVWACVSLKHTDTPPLQTSTVVPRIMPVWSVVKLLLVSSGGEQPLSGPWDPGGPWVCQCCWAFSVARAERQVVFQM